MDKEVQPLVAQLLEGLKVDLRDPDFQETPRRLSSYLSEHFYSPQVAADRIAELKRAVFPSPNKDMVVVKAISVNGVCPHHVLPVLYKVSIGYIPDGHVLGLSKLARVAGICLARPVLQETGTVEVASAMSELLGTKHVAVVVRGRHLCMELRGVRQAATVTVTSDVRGLFRTDPTVKSEFLHIESKD